jgi:hypothetical protein
MPGGMPGMPGMPGTPGLPGADGTGSTAGTNGASSGSSTGTGSTAGTGSTGSGNDPFGGLGTAGSGTMTAGERRAALDERLQRGYAVFDGMILGERERAQNDADAAGSTVMGTGGGGGTDGAGGEGGEAGIDGPLGDSPIIVAGAGTGVMPTGATAREGEFDNQNQPSFPVPGDIPSGDDDDVVARQLREAAMREPDPELREKLWDEYRKYTGLNQ